MEDISSMNRLDPFVMPFGMADLKDAYEMD